MYRRWIAKKKLAQLSLEKQLALEAWQEVDQLLRDAWQEPVALEEARLAMETHLARKKWEEVDQLWKNALLALEEVQLKKKKNGLTQLEPVILSASKSFNQRQKEEWLGELFEMLEDMEERQEPQWRIWTYCLYELASLFIAAVRLKLSRRAEKTGD